MNLPQRKDSRKPKQRIITVPNERSRAVWLSDLHFPHQDDAAIEIALNYAAKNKADVIVLGGDILDNTPFSRFGHETKDEDIAAWFDMVIYFLQRLRKRFPKALIYWLEGNHDIWFKKYIVSNARVLQNDNYFTLQKRLRLDETKVEYLPENIVLKFADLYLHHGHLFFRGKCLPISPARTVFSKTKASTLCGHVHQQSQWVEKTIEGVRIKCYTTGCLSELTPNYSPFNQYCHGFADIKRDGKKAIVRNFVIDGTLED
ncbi:MAG: metallophosphoesterase family protein [Ferruginibacter sp.]